MSDDDTRELSSSDALLHELQQTKVVASEEAAADQVDSELLDELSAISAATTLPGHPAPGAEHARIGDGEQTVTLRPHPVPPAWQSLVARLRREAAAASSTRRSAVLLHELGRIYETQLELPDEACEFYRKSHERYPRLGVNARALARLLARRGDHGGAARMLQAEIDAAGSAGERVAILAARGLLRFHELGDVDGAREDLQRALEIDAEDAVAMSALLELYEQTGELELYEALLRRRIDRCEQPAVRSALLCTLARLLEERRGDSQDAATTYRTALNTDPHNTHALRALLRTARKNHDYPSVAKLCESLAETEHGATAAATLWQAARIYANRLRNTDLAIQSLQRACERSPDDPALLLDLATLLEREKRWAELAEVLARAAPLTGDPSEGALVAFRLGRLRLERLHDPQGAVEALQQAVTLAPDHMPARTLLGRLYIRRERYNDLVDLLGDELELFEDPARRAATAFRIGDIHERLLQDSERALDAYERALELRPGFRPAIRGISRVYRDLGRYDDLVAVYERELAATTEREERTLLLRRISELWERQLDDPAAALNAYERLLAIEPSNLPAMRALYRIYALGNRWSDLVAVLRSEADQTMDRWRRVTLLTEMAEIQERRIGDQQAALATYEEVLGHAPTYQPALMAAGRLLQQAGDVERLVALHRQELDNTEHGRRRAWLLMKIGRLLLERLDRADEATEAYAEAMQLTPLPNAAADQLLRIYREREDHQQLLSLLLKLPLPESPRAQALHHRTIAEVLQRGERPPLAIEHLRRAIGAAGDDAAFDQLSNLYAAIGDRQRLIALYQSELERTTDRQRRLSVLHRLARLWSAAPQDLHHAAAAYEQILSHTPHNRVALRQLEALFSRLQQWSDLAAVLELGRRDDEDRDFDLATALVIAALREDRLDDLTGAAQCAVEVLERHPTQPEALSTLERHARRRGDTDRLLQVLTRQLKAAQTAAEQAALLCAMGAVHANREEQQQALEYFTTAAQLAPSYLPACRAWAAVAEKLRDNRGRAEALELEARASNIAARRAAADFEAAQLWQKDVDDPERAIAALHRVLETDPRHQGALDALSNLYSARKDHQQLVELLEHRARHAEEPRARADLLARAADLQRSRLQDLLGARRTINRAIELFPDDRQLLATLAELCRASKDWPALSKVDQRLVRLTSDPVLLQALHFELGRIWEEHLPDIPRAVAAYRRVLELDPHDLGALTSLSTLLYNREEWRDAADVTERLVRRDDDRTRVKGHHLRLAHIYADGFDDIERAIGACRAALALDPGDLPATEQMADLLEQKDDRRALHAHLESSLSVHRARLRRDPFEVASYRSLTTVFARQRLLDHVFVAQTVLCGIDRAEPAEFEAVRHQRPTAPAQPRRPLTPEEIEGVALHPQERGALRQLLQAAAPALRKLFGRAARSVAKPRKITSRSHPELAAMIRAFSKAVGGAALNAYAVEGGVEQLRVEDTQPPSVFLGEDIDESEDELRFRAARLVARARLDHLLLLRLGAEDLGRVVAALISCACASYDPPLPAGDLEQVRAPLEKVLSKRARAAIEGPSLELLDRPLAPQRWLSWFLQSEDRLALSVTGDVLAAIEVLKKDEGATERLADDAGPRLRQLLNFAVADEHLTLRSRVGLAV